MRNSLKKFVVRIKMRRLTSLQRYCRIISLPSNKQCEDRLQLHFHFLFAECWCPSRISQLALTPCLIISIKTSSRPQTLPHNYIDVCRRALFSDSIPILHFLNGMNVNCVIRERRQILQEEKSNGTIAAYVKGWKEWTPVKWWRNKKVEYVYCYTCKIHN